MLTIIIQALAQVLTITILLLLVLTITILLLLIMVLLLFEVALTLMDIIQSPYTFFVCIQWPCIQPICSQVFHFHFLRQRNLIIIAMALERTCFLKEAFPVFIPLAFLVFIPLAFLVLIPLAFLVLIPLAFIILLHYY